MRIWEGGKVQYEGEDFDNTNGIGKAERPFVGDYDHCDFDVNIDRCSFEEIGRLTHGSKSKPGDRNTLGLPLSRLSSSNAECIS
jgi:hypothetical protein